MSKLIDNEASREASFGILEALKEAENVEVKKTVMYEGACTGCKSCEEPEGSNDPVPGEDKEPLKEDEEDKEKLDDAIALADAETKTEEQEEIVSDDDTAVVEAEEKIVEGLKVLESANGAFLLKESAGYIVGKNYNEKTGIIEEAECYKTEKVARRVFDKISK